MPDELMMKMLYDSENYAVVYIKTGEQEGFEIANKHEAKSVYLLGNMAGYLTMYMREWEVDTPTTQQVEELLERLTQLNSNPLVMH